MALLAPQLWAQSEQYVCKTNFGFVPFDFLPGDLYGGHDIYRGGVFIQPVKVTVRSGRRTIATYTEYEINIYDSDGNWLAGTSGHLPVSKAQPLLDTLCPGAKLPPPLPKSAGSRAASSAPAMPPSPQAAQNILIADLNGDGQPDTVQLQ